MISNLYETNRIALIGGAAAIAAILAVVILLIVSRKRARRDAETDTGQGVRPWESADRFAPEPWEEDKTAITVSLPKNDGVFEIEYEITFIHTDEIIT